MADDEIVPVAQIHRSLAAALVAAQSEMPSVEKTATANYGKYATLDTLVAKTRPVLNRHGIAIIQFPSMTELGEPTLRLILVHGPTGESMETTMPLILAKEDMQSFGSAVTYAKRYSWSAALGIAADDDDDGAAATATPRTRRQPDAKSGETAAQVAGIDEAEPALIENLRGLLIEDGIEEAAIEASFAAMRRANSGVLPAVWVEEKTEAAEERLMAKEAATTQASILEEAAPVVTPEETLAESIRSEIAAETAPEGAEPPSEEPEAAPEVETSLDPGPTPTGA